MEVPRVRLALALACTLVAFSLVAAPAAAATPTYPTTGVVKTSITFTSIGPSEGLLVNYTTSFTASFGGFVYVDLTNAAGQTAYWNVAYCGFTPGQTTQCFVAVSSTVHTGTYTAHVFTTTTGGVAVSGVSTLQVTV